MKRAALSDLPPMLLNKEGKNHLGFVSDDWNQRLQGAECFSYGTCS